MAGAASTGADGGSGRVTPASEHSREPAPESQPGWQHWQGQRVVFLLDASSGLEGRELEAWIERHRPEQAAHLAVEKISLPPSRRPRRRARVDARLETSLASGDNPLLAPLRIAWLAPDRHAGRHPRLISLLVLGDPYDPGRLRQWWIKRRAPHRCRVVVGEPAPLSDLRDRWRKAGGAAQGETHGLPDYVARQAALALERAERRLRGMRYKVPRFVAQSILERPSFQGGLARLAWELGKEATRVRHQAAEYLQEIAATHSPYVIDLTAQLCRTLYTRGYGDQLHYDRGQLEEIYRLAQRSPVVFLPSHKSNLDHLVLQYALYENGHPPNHTAGGINMNFMPIGPVLRRSGVFFIRRTFKDNPVYKFVLAHYVDYLIEKRFPLEWYIEGGRSRSGKLLPPRFGMLAYVVDAYRRGCSEDVYLLPVSIAYDQIQDVGSYVAEQRGGEKEREGLRWFVRMVRMLRRRYGGIYIRFGEPVSLRQAMGPPDPDAEPNADERSIEIRKLAFEVSVRINRVTPITPTSLVTMALLGAGDRALTLEETVKAVDPFAAYVASRRLPSTEPIDLEDAPAVRRALEGLIENGVVACFAEGPQPVYAIKTEQHLAAAFYRNSIIHFFVNGAIAELALLRASAADIDDPAAHFWAETLALRDLLKFEFFFAGKEEFRREIESELERVDSNWSTALAAGRDEVRSLLTRFKPFTAHLVLRPFLEAYRVVSDVLAADENTEVDEARFLAECLALGRQYQLQRRICNAESVSKVFFTTALRLARNRGLSDAEADVAERRRCFAEEMRETIVRIDAIEALAAGRRAGLID